MQTFIDKFIMPTTPVKTKINNMLEYNLKNKTEDEITNYGILTWATYLPPLHEINRQIKLSLVDDFNKKITMSIKSKNNNQFEYLNSIRSKIIYFTFNIKQNIDTLIQNDIKKESAILLTSNKEPFLENACCSTNYFIEDNIQITNDIYSIDKIEKFINKIKNIDRTPIIFNNKNTKRDITVLRNDIHNDIIYEYFIYNCKNNKNNVYIKELCKNIPDHLNKFYTMDNKIKLLKESNINFTIDDFNKLLNIKNLDNITNISLSNIIINNNQKQLSLINHLDDYNVDIIPNKFRNFIKKLLETYEINNLSQDIPDMRNIKNYLYSENALISNKIKTFMIDNLSKSKYNKFVEWLDNINSFKITGNNNLIDEVDETLNKNIGFAKTNIHLLTKVFINIIKNKVNYKNVNINKNWSLSDKHENDVRNIINLQYSSLYKFFDDADIKRIVTLLNIKFDVINLFISNIYFNVPLKINNEYKYSVFDRKIINSIFKYLFLIVINEFISILDNGDLFKSDENDKLPPSIISLDNNQDIEIILGKKEVFTKKISELLYELLNIANNNRVNLDYNYISLKEKLIRSKEKEKDGITNKLMRLSDEEREIENYHKIHKLNDWGIAQQKGFREYNVDVYDKERKALEDQTIMEMKLNKQDGVTKMNMDIYAIEDIENEYNNNLIEKEEYNMASINENNDGNNEDFDNEY
jgi:hypothetical protein